MPRPPNKEDFGKTAPASGKACLAFFSKCSKTASTVSRFCSDKPKLAGAVKDTETKTYTLEEILPVQKLSLQEQAEAQRGQTMDTRSDGTTPIAGSIGKQNSLYAQQVVSYQKDSQLKAAKVFSDVWITCRSIDEGFPLPTQFDTAATQAAMQAIIDANDLG